MPGKRNKVQKVAYLGLMSALAVLCGYVEYLIPVSASLPGIKLGICNIVILIVLYTGSWKDAAAVSFVRILVIGFLFGSLSSIWYSLCGGMASLAVMTLLQKSGKFRIAGLSAAGGVAHEAGQLAAAAVMVTGFPILWYLPLLMLAGLASGIVIGFLSGEILIRLPKSAFG